MVVQRAPFAGGKLISNVRSRDQNSLRCQGRRRTRRKSVFGILDAVEAGGVQGARKTTPAKRMGSSWGAHTSTRQARPRPTALPHTAS